MTSLTVLWSNPVRPATCCTYCSRSSSLGSSRNTGAARSTARVRPSGVVRSAPANTRSSLNCAKRDALSTAFTNAVGSSRHRSPGSFPGGSAATFTSMSNRCSHWYHFSAAFCPAASASYASTTCRVNDLRICTWSSASAVPQVATELGTPASVKPMTSVYPSQITTSSRAPISALAQFSPYSSRLLWYSADSAVFLYFGPSSVSVRPPKPTAWPARS